MIPLYELKAEDIRQYSIETLKEHIQMEAHGYYCTTEMIFDVVLKASAECSSVEATCADLLTVADSNTIRDYLKLIELDWRELFSINRDGKIEQMTFLSRFSPESEIIAYSWSPNGRFISLLIKYGGKYHTTVAILDTVTGELKDYCIPVNENYLKSAMPFIWSPNNQQLLIQDQYSDDHRRIIMLDIRDGSSFQFAEDVEPIAWLNFP